MNRKEKENILDEREQSNILWEIKIDRTRKETLNKTGKYPTTITKKLQATFSFSNLKQKKKKSITKSMINIGTKVLIKTY